MHGDWKRAAGILRRRNYPFLNGRAVLGKRTKIYLPGPKGKRRRRQKGDENIPRAMQPDFSKTQPRVASTPKRKAATAR